MDLGVSHSTLAGLRLADCRIATLLARDGVKTNDGVQKARKIASQRETRQRESPAA